MEPADKTGKSTLLAEENVNVVILDVVRVYLISMEVGVSRTSIREGRDIDIFI